MKNQTVILTCKFRGKGQEFSSFYAVEQRDGKFPPNFFLYSTFIFRPYQVKKKEQYISSNELLFSDRNSIDIERKLFEAYASQM